MTVPNLPPNPFFHLETTFSPNPNRFIVASTELPTSESIVSCRPLAFAPFQSHRKRVCAGCMAVLCLDKSTAPQHDDAASSDQQKEIPKPASTHPYRCTCDQVYFCSYNCARDCMVNGHRLVCGGLRKIATNVKSIHDCSVLRVVVELCCVWKLEHGYSECGEDIMASIVPVGHERDAKEDDSVNMLEDALATLSMSDTIQEPIPECEEPKKHPDTTNDTGNNNQLVSVDRLPTFSDFLALESHRHDWSSDVIADWRKSLRLLIRILTESSLMPSHVIRSDTSCETMDAHESYLLDMISRIECNGFGIWSPMKPDLCMGRAVYPLASFFNHSCDPNCESIKPGSPDTLTFRTIRAIHPSEPITISYIDTNMPVSSRRSKLQSEYWFMCGCDKCERELSGKGGMEPNGDSSISYAQSKYSHSKHKRSNASSKKKRVK